ncbi:cysteine hydrolase family protein [Sorangium sp. So ce406]|uniref:cysteine hydrolase family protein n=1 Tax=Sorangium sp. So ce406 TaxID=3133311 RepID=UPI003F5C01D3
MASGNMTRQPSPPRVFVDVDVQRDFCDETGALYVKGSPNALFRRLTEHAVARGIPIVGSVDSHAWDAWEFGSNDTPAPEGGKPGFPDHCVKGTPGWLKVEGTLPPRFRFIPNVPDAPVDTAVRELATGQTHGVYFEKEVYSLFANPVAEGFLRELSAALGGAPEFVVYGVATDYCVRAAALGLVQRGYRTTLLTDAVAGITEAGVAAALGEMQAAGVALTTSSTVLV